MVRRARVEVTGGLYHVYNRFASGERIFAEPDEAAEFIEILKDVKKRDGWHQKRKEEIGCHKAFICAGPLSS